MMVSQVSRPGAKLSDAEAAEKSLVFVTCGRLHDSTECILHATCGVDD